MDNTKPGKRFSYIFPITLLAANAVACIVITVMLLADGTALKLYKDIGAVPWHTPAVETKIGSSETFSEEDINSAIKVTVKKYEDEWYTYNGTYLLELTYDEEFCTEINEKHSQGGRIYFAAKMYTGYGDDVAEENKGIFHYDAYWGCEKKPDGSWECLGCAQLPEKYAYMCIYDDKDKE